MIDTSLLDNIIVGRIPPHIYAFRTNTIPDYLKIGDTYRPVNVRIEEWRKYFGNLVHEDGWQWEAQTSNGKYFRDFAVHNYLLNQKHLQRLQPNDIPDLPYYSKEFFKHATPEDIDDALVDIEKYASQVNGPYQFYSEDRLHIEEHYERTEKYLPRPNQEDTINRFIEARNQGRRNLLMYAVMRFGKSFTSMCCATAMKAKVVLIVSAKADVKNEWKRTLESHVRFAEYDFLDSAALITNNKTITNHLNQGKCVAVFLTLQDLMGNDIKDKHQDIFSNTIDLLIVDETHFGARAEEYGKVLRNAELTNAQIKKELACNDESYDDLDKGLEVVKQLYVDTTLHLSGTPYRILMGSEFKPEDIIAFYQFTDIIDDKDKWDSEHEEDIEQEVINVDTNKPYQDWDNPYYGFPQMVRFAFNPSKKAREMLKQLEEQGKTASLTELFRPKSVCKDTSATKAHRLFAHEQEVLDLLRVIDGNQKDENLLGFLDYDKLKEGKMCRHIVCVLPFCASCDAMEKLLMDNERLFKNLSHYKIINISGIEGNTYSTTEDIKRTIAECEEIDQKTITLTVNRMLTGSTVREWDTMLFLKDVSSPQEYDQAIFRLQNQYVKTYKDAQGNVIRYNMKPQTLLVDFDPNRMFVMQEQKSKIYNANTEERGNELLEERIRKELKISPIIVINSSKICEVEPSNIIDAVRQYSANRTVMDEAREIPTDFELLKDPRIQLLIKELEPINAQKGINIKPTKGDGKDLDDPNDNGGNENSNGNGDGENNNGKGGNPDDPNDNDGDGNRRDDGDNADKRLATYFVQILFFALLTDYHVSSLKEIIRVISIDTNNMRIARNVGLKLPSLIYVNKHLNSFILQDLDYKIQNISDLACDTSLPPLERVERALRKFGRLSISEIVTPSKVADDVVALLPEDDINETTKFLDIASKQAEFACALYRRFGDKVRDNIWSLPTSKLTYEFTRKVYSLLRLPIKNIISSFSSYDIIGEHSKTYIDILKNMKFNAIVGNPPYQKMDGGAGASAVPVYNSFVETAKDISLEYISIIIPSRWMTGGRGLEDFRLSMIDDKHISKLYDFYEAGVCFNNVEIKGGVCYFLRDINHNDKCEIHTQSSNGYTQISNRYLRDGEENIFIRDSELIEIKKQVASFGEDGFDTIVSSMKPYGLRGDFFKNPAKYGLPPIRKEKKEGDITIIGLDEKQHRTRRYIPQDYPLPQRDLLEDIKLFIPRNYGTGRMGDMPSNMEYAMPYDVCTETFIQIGPFKSLEEAKNCEDYMRTKFFTVLVGIRKQDQGAGKSVYHYAPLQDFSIKWTDEMLFEKYGLTDKQIAYINMILSK